MRCPNCGSENNDSAKFCKKCGTPLADSPAQTNVVEPAGGEKSGSDNTKIIIAVLIVVVIVLAGAFAYLYGFGSNHSDESSQVQSSNASNKNITADNDNDTAESDTAQSSEPVQATQTTHAQPAKSKMTIKGGSFSTGSAEEDLTYASIYVGTEHAGEDVTVQIFYSRDGNTLNHGNMVPVTVHSDGYIEVKSADAYHYYPDYATINLYEPSGSLIDTQSVSLTPTSGTQTF